MSRIGRTLVAIALPCLLISQAARGQAVSTDETVGGGRDLRESTRDAVVRPVGPESRAEWGRIAIGALPEDLLRPERRTRWDLSSLEVGERFTRTVTLNGDGSAVVLDVESGDKTAVVSRESILTAPAGSDAIGRWLQPHLAIDLLDHKRARPIALSLEKNDRGYRSTETLEVAIRRVGMGWLVLPSGPRQVVLQRVDRVTATADPSDGARAVLYRWVDPRFGVVAVAAGSAHVDGRGFDTVDSVEVVENVLAGTLPLKIYADELDAVPYERVAYGFDRGADTMISEMTPDAHATIAELLAATQWDFSPTTPANSVAEIATTRAVVDSDETCNDQSCGFTIPGAKLGREDKNFEDPQNAFITLSVVEREQRAADVTIWLRAGVRHEGISEGGLGENESRFCYTDETGQNVPLWRFSHEDATGFYMQNGDAWDHDPFTCDQNLNNHVCPDPCGAFCPLYTYACDDYAGTLSNEIVAQGPVTLPSGHTFEALVVKNVVSFCTTIFANCTFDVERVRQGIYLWVVPNIGTVARLMSLQDTPDIDNFSTLSETDIKYGVFPPLSISGDAATGSSVQISWDPGLDTRRIDGYKIYWDTDSGVDSPYAFNSVDHFEQVAVDGTTATISGLSPSTEYFFTVVALSDYTNVSTGITRTFESVLYPLRVTGTPVPVPSEVSMTTEGGTCVPTVEVQQLTMDRVEAGIHACWQAVDDVCADGYSFVGSATADSDAGFSTVVGDTGPVTCHTFDSAETFYLVTSKGSGGTGPWGHYGR